MLLKKVSLLPFWDLPDVERQQRCVLLQDLKCRMRQVFLDGKDVTALNPEDRDVNTVFQNYALFPHMNVADNIGYGLRLKRFPGLKSAE